MTRAQRDRLKGFDASLKTRGVSVVLKPGDVALLGLVEVVDDQTRRRLQIADDPATHIVHLRRTDLLAVDCQGVAEIERTDSEQTYRVQHFKDDPQRPAILFFCLLS